MAESLHYDSSYYELRENSFAFIAELKTMINYLSPCGDDKILEIGCGNGALLRNIRKCNWHLLAGVDRFPLAAKLAAERNRGILIACADALDLPFPGNFFTKIVAQHLIEHFDNPENILREWKRVLMPGGRMVLCTPNYLFPHQEWFEDPTHCHIFTLKELTELVEIVGFRVETVSVINPFVLHLRLQNYAAKYLQFLSYMPFFKDHGMSIILSATKPLN